MIDMKLDRYVTRKAAAGRIPNLLIDRFRFDSFPGRGRLRRRRTAAHPIRRPGLHPVHGHAARRHCRAGMEAGRGVRPLQGRRGSARPRRRGLHGHAAAVLHLGVGPGQAGVFEFLDNGVAQGQRPRTIAFGAGESLNILDVKGLIDIERFRKVDIYARAPEAIFRGSISRPRPTPPSCATACAGSPPSASCMPGPAASSSASNAGRSPASTRTA